MNVATEIKAASSNKSRSLRPIAMIVVFFFVMLLLSVGTIGPIELSLYFAFGWIFFLVRTVPKITFNADLIAMTVICLAVTLFLANHFLKWLLNRIADSKGWSFRWRLKWTVAGAALIGLLFLVGMSVIGVVHQISWMASSPEPLYVRSGISFVAREHHYMRLIQASFQETESHDISGLRKELNDAIALGTGNETNTVLNRYHILVISNATSPIDAALIFPRDIQMRKKIGGMLVSRSSEEWLTAAELPKAIALHRSELIALQ